LSLGTIGWRLEKTVCTCTVTEETRKHSAQCIPPHTLDSAQCGYQTGVSNFFLLEYSTGN